MGGPARHVVWLTTDLADEFESVLVTGCVPPGEEDMGYLAEQNGIEPIFIEEMSRELSIKDLTSLIKIYRLMRRERPDIVCTHTAKAGTVGRAAAFLYKWMTPSALLGRPRKLIVTHTFHGHVFHSYYGPLKTRAFILIEKLLARLATDRVIVISLQQYKEIHEQVGVGNKSQFSIVPLGIDLQPFAEAAAKRKSIRAELNATNEKLVIGFVGRLTEIKNIPMYLAAAAKYEDAVDEKRGGVHFWIAGDGHLRRELESKAEELKIKNLSFLGNRQEVPTVYAGIDIVALTSLNEGTPLSLIEGMASGKAVISTTVGGVADLLGKEVDKRDGFVVYERGIGVAPNDVDGFVKGLIYLVKNERLRDELAANGRDFVLSNYSKDRMVNDLRLLYRKLAGEHVKTG